MPIRISYTIGIENMDKKVYVCVCERACFVYVYENAYTRNLQNTDPLLMLLLYLLFIDDQF